MKSIINMLIIYLLIISNTTGFEYLKVKAPPAFIVNQVTTYQEQYSRVLELSNGNFVIAWYSTTAQSSLPCCGYLNVYFNLYDSDANRLTQNYLTVNSPNANQAMLVELCSDGNGGFAIVWQELNQTTNVKVLMRRYNSDLTADNIINVKQSTSLFHAYPSIDRLANGGYVVLFNVNSSQAYFQLFDSTFKTIGSNVAISQNNPAKTSDIIVNTNNQVGNQDNGALTLLTNGNVFVTWNDRNINNCDVFGKIYDQYGNAVTGVLNINTTTNGSQDIPRPFTLAWGEFGVVWQSQGGAGQIVNLQIFDNDGNKIGKEQMVNTDTTYSTGFPHATEFTKNGHILVTWTRINPNSGGDRDVYAQIYYKNDGICRHILAFIGNSGGITNSVLIDFSSIIYYNIILTTLPNLGQLNDDTQKAISVNTFIDKTKIFYTYSTLSADPFTYATNTVDISCTVTIAPCYQTCFICAQAGNDNNHRCLQCAPNAYSTSDNSNNCYSSTPKGYYLDTSTKIYNKCYESCLTCPEKGDSGNNNCSTCGSNYYNLEDLLSQCYLSTEIITSYFFNFETLNFTKCFSSCNTCRYLGNINQHLCSTCNNNFFPLEDDASMCFSKDAAVEGYYLDFELSVFKKCYKACGKCTGPGDIINPNCIECAPNYPKCNGCSQKIYKESCVDNCPVLTVYDALTKTCIECKTGEIVLNNECLSICPDGYIQDLYTCITCIEKNYYNYKKTCVQQCPGGSTLNANTNTCEIKCDFGYFDNDKDQCITCKTILKIYFQGQCVDNCPEGYTQVDNNCQKKPNSIGKIILI
jgi:hypothetical protein